MSSMFTLDDLREAADKKFGGVKVQLDSDGDTVAKVRNLFQLTKTEKESILELLDEMGKLQDRAETSTEWHKAKRKIEKDNDLTDELRDQEIAALGAEPESPEEGDDDRLFEIMRECIKIACDKHAALLLRELTKDDTLTITLFSEWMEAAEVGEAEDSPKN